MKEIGGDGGISVGPSDGQPLSLVLHASVLEPHLKGTKEKEKKN